MKVEDTCSRQVVTIRGEDTLIEAARRMREHHVGALVVVETQGSVNAPRGIITDRDLVISVLAVDPEDMHRLLVADVMSDELVTVPAGAPLEDAVDRMRAAGTRRLPVVDDAGALVGILTLDDLVDAAARQAGMLAAIVQTSQGREWRHRN